MSNDALNDRHPGEFSSPDDIRSRGQIFVIVFDVVGLTNPITFTVEVVQP